MAWEKFLACSSASWAGRAVLVLISLFVWRAVFELRDDPTGLFLGAKMGFAGLIRECLLDQRHRLIPAIFAIILPPPYPNLKYKNKGQISNSNNHSNGRKINRVVSICFVY